MNHGFFSVKTMKHLMACWLFAAMGFAASVEPSWAMRAGGSDILLQAFHWRAKNNGQHGAWYDLIASRAQDIAETGVTLVWFPPPSKTSRYDLDEFGDWASANGYVPMDYYDLGEYQQWVQDGWPPNRQDGQWYQHAGSETLWGSRAELQNAIAALKGRGVKVLADIVLNHRGPRQVNRCGEAISWGDDLGRVASGRLVWGHYNDCSPQEIIGGDGGSGCNDDGESAFTPNLAHCNPVVRNAVKEWMAWLKNTIGFDGWRYDYVKGYAPSHVGEYNDHTQPTWSIGEYFEYDNTQAIINWIDGTHTDNDRRSAAFDFPTKKVLTQNFGTHNYAALSSLPGLMGRWPAKAVTFLDNHDTYPPHDNPYPFPDNRLLEGYAYILTHPGTPTIYWQHFYDKSPVIHGRIKELAQIRRQAGITNTSSVRILRAEQDLYAAEIDGRLVTKIGSKPWQPGDAGLGGYALRTEFGDYKIWTQGGSTTTTLRIQKDVGFGNFISVRGSLPQLGNWGPGPHCNWTAGNVWECKLPSIPAGQAFQWKALRNDTQWECDIPGDCQPNHCGKGGEVVTVTPCGL